MKIIKLSDNVDFHNFTSKESSEPTLSPDRRTKQRKHFKELKKSVGASMKYDYLIYYFIFKLNI